MLILITGGSKCGKSSLAESYFEGLDKGKYYIATMIPYGDEAHAAIERHRKIRAGKGFETIEKYTDLSEIKLPEHSAVLLECMGNLCANEMFSSEKICDPTDKILSDIEYLNSSTDLLVIVSNDVGSDGIDYTVETMQYMKSLSLINSEIAAIADTVIECVYGIPVVMKGELGIK